ncbi:MAG: FAD-binding oxidoreductase [Candidatus Paceibacterota bacterium]|jgi:FAD/FMN-containing dehydrogenase
MANSNHDSQGMKEYIKTFFKGDVLDDIETLKFYSHDASLLEVKPKIVVFPKDADDVKALVKWVSEQKKYDPTLSITARSAGTCMSGGPLNESIIMDFTKYMHGILEIKETPDGGVARVLPGTYYRDFEEETLKHGLLYPAYPASKSICALGGIVSNNGAGEKTLHYGKAENYVAELKVVFTDGNEYVVKPITESELIAKTKEQTFEGDIYKKIYELIENNKEAIMAAKPAVSKNSAGYYLWNIWDEEKKVFDLNKLITGSQGTLGIVTEITMKLVPVKKHSKMLAIFMNELSPLGKIVDAILPLDPESLESYDDKTLKLAIRFWRGFIKKRGFIGFIKMGISFIPEFFMLLTGGMPKLVLLVEFAGNDEAELLQKIETLENTLIPFGLKTRRAENIEDVEKYWSIRRDSFALLREKVKDKHTAPFIDDIIVRPEYLPEFLPKLSTLLSQYPIEYTIAGHAGNGNFHIIPLMDFSRSETTDIILKLSDKVYDLVLLYKGSITAEHNDGIIRTPFLKKMYGEKIYSLFEQTKKIFDPLNIFNPGKKVGGTKEYLRWHIRKNF